MRPLTATAALLTTIALSAPAAAEGLARGFDIIPREGALPTVWIAADAGPEVALAAADLAEALAQMAGRPPPPVRRRGAERPDAQGIHLGPAPPDPSVPQRRFSRRSRLGGTAAAGAPAPAALPALPQWADPHGTRDEGWSDVWMLRAARDRLHLWGNDNMATAQSVYWFLQQHGDVRWYFPGEAGRFVPARRHWHLPETRERAEPGYVARRLRMDAGDTPEGLWARRNLLREHFDYNHNMHRIIRAEEFPACPECFPVFDGKREPPQGNPLYTWQPNLLSEDVIRRTARAAITRFETNPDARSFSISLNDNIHFGDYPPGVDPRETGRTFRGHYDYANLVFGFANQVAARVAERFPGRYLGSLAYAAWENVPDFTVAPNLIPYLTSDRSQWYDPDFRAGDLALARAWTANGPRITGTWDYSYGAPFIIPRLYLNSTAESIAALHTAGVRAYSAELAPNWGYDAPKAWLSAQLLVNPEADAATLMDRFFHDNYGPAAAAMRRFFDACEAAWMTQPTPARWIKFYLDTHQAALFPPPILENLASILNDAEARAETHAQRLRIDITRRVFNTTRAFAAMQQASWALSRAAATSPVDRNARDSALVRYAQARAEFVAEQQALASDP